jgi:hypothetical protein
MRASDPKQEKTALHGNRPSSVFSPSRMKNPMLRQFPGEALKFARLFVVKTDRRLVMKLSQSSRVQPAIRMTHGRAIRLGPGRVTAATRLEADADHGLQELLNVVQERAHGTFQGEEEVRQAVNTLATELEQMGAAATRLLRDASRQPSPFARKRVDTSA